MANPARFAPALHLLYTCPKPVWRAALFGFGLRVVPEPSPDVVIAGVVATRGIADAA
jgi:hypothetical protein